jgi:hypothetical protein
MMTHRLLRGGIILTNQAGRGRAAAPEKIREWKYENRHLR